jgi:hypothetical protein
MMQQYFCTNSLLKLWESINKPKKSPEKLADECRKLLAAFIDAQVLKGFVVTQEQWDMACFLCGRWCPPFTKKQLKPEDYDE